MGDDIVLKQTVTIDRVLQTVGGVLLMVTMALQGWMLQTVVANANRITAIEANRFTASDGMELMRLIEAVRRDMPPEVPPKWFQAQVDSHTQMMRRLDERLDSIEQRLARLDGIKQRE